MENDALTIEAAKIGLTQAVTAAEQHVGGKAAKRGFSHEQVPVLVTRDRSGATMDCVVPTDDTETLSAALKPFVPSDAMLCTDGSKSLAGVARALNVEHHAINVSAGIRVDGPWHIQNVNAYHSRLKAWIAKFRAIDRARNDAPKPARWFAMAVGVRG